MVRFSLRLPDDLHARLAARAEADRRSLNAEILVLLEVALAAAKTARRHGGDAPELRGKPDSSPA